MTSTIIDIDAFLAPISEDKPCGEDIRENPSPTSDYQTIKAARNSARTAERNNMFDADNSEAEDHWRKVQEVAPKILKEQSKDIEIASWYTEAMIRQHGIPGLHACLLIIRGLIDDFWDNLYPLPDEYGIETRVSPLSGLNGEGAEGVLIAPIRNCLITQGNQHGPFTYWQYTQALDASHITDFQAKESADQKLGFTLDNVESAVNDSSSDFFVTLRDQLNESIEAYEATSAKLDDLCGIHEAPPTSKIINTLKECVGAINHIAKNKFPIEAVAEEIPAEADGEESSGQAAPAQQAQMVPGAILNRDQAFKHLLDIAEYFRKNEPHSPVSYILQKAVKWGNMPLDQLIDELIPDGNSREHYGVLTGVKSEN